MSAAKYANLPDIVRLLQAFCAHSVLILVSHLQDTAQDIYETEDVYPTTQAKVISASCSPSHANSLKLSLSKASLATRNPASLRVIPIAERTQRFQVKKNLTAAV